LRRSSEAPDGCSRWLAAGSKDKDAFVWRLGDDGPVGIPLVLHGHLLPITALAFSADGNWLATGSDDHTARLWNLRSPDPAIQPVVLQGHTAEVTALAFSPDSRWLATGSKDHTVRLWSLSLDRLIELACSGAGRNLTQDEWIEFLPPGEPYHKTCIQWP
jgi:WD40 repeat protein